MSEYRRTDNFVRCGDVVYLESFSNPGWFIKPKNGVNVLGWGREDAAVQVVAPSLRFAIKLGERTSMYRAAAGEREERSDEVLRIYLSKVTVALSPQFRLATLKFRGRKGGNAS